MTLAMEEGKASNARALLSGCGNADQSDCKQKQKVDGDGVDFGRIFGTVMNLTKTIVGSGMLGLPHALQDGGAGLGMALLPFTCAMSLAGFVAVGFVCRATGAEDYQDAWQKTVGRATTLIDAMIVVECGINSVCYVVIFLDDIQVGLQGLFNVTLGRTTLAASFAALVMPLCFKRDFHDMRFTSLLGNAVIAYTLMYVILECLVSGGYRNFSREASFFAPEVSGVFRSVGVMTCAYISHYSAPGFYKELAEVDVSSAWSAFRASSVCSFVVAVVAYGCFAVAGFSRFAPDVKGNVLLGYSGGPLVYLAWIAIAAALFLTFPLQFKLVRDTLAKTLPTQHDAPARSAWAAMVVICVVVFSLSAVVLTDVSRVLAFRGALTGCHISFTLPGMMLLRCPGSTNRIGAWVLIVFGMFAGATGLFAALSS